jgi:hypothetical protein
MARNRGELPLRGFGNVTVLEIWQSFEIVDVTIAAGPGQAGIYEIPDAS